MDQTDSQPHNARRTVLVTRPTSPFDRLPALLQGRAFMSVTAPFMRIKTRTPSLPPSPQAILVTSANALATTAPQDTPLLAVGDATAARAREAGFANVTSAAGDATALARLAAATLHPGKGPLLLLSGARQGHALASALRGSGFRVARRVTYTASPVSRFPGQAAQALTDDALHAAIFLSAETATAFARLIPAAAATHLPGVLALAIGNAAAGALKPLPWRQIRIASTPTLDGVLALL